MDRPHVLSARVPQLNRVLQATRRRLRSVRLLAVWGGATYPEYDPRFGDLDVVAVVPPLQVPSVASVAALVAELESFVQLDLFVTDLDRLSLDRAEFMDSCGRPYRANPVVQHQLRATGQVVFGDPLLWNTSVRPLSLSQALQLTSPTVRKAIQRLRTDLHNTDVSQTVAAHLSTLLVCARSIAALDTSALPSKRRAVGLVRAKYPEHANLMRHLESAYERRESCDALTHSEVCTFLDLVNRLLSDAQSASVANGSKPT